MNAAQEQQRLDTLRRYGVLDTASETVFERIAQLAAFTLDAPIAIVGFLDETRHCFKSAVGTSTTQNARAGSFCTRTIQQSELLEVRDALADERFNHLPVVTRDGIRAYAGAPLTTADGQHIGTLCVFHRAPRPKLLEIEKEWLHQLAAITMRALDFRLARQPFPDSFEALLNGLNLQWQALFGRGEEPLAPAREAGGSLTERLFSRIRATPPAPALARVARLPRGRALIVHGFGDAPPGRTWQTWAVARGGGPEPLTTFTAPLGALTLPGDAALLLLSNEQAGITSSQPQEILASGSLEMRSGTPGTPLL